MGYIDPRKAHKYFEFTGLALVLILASILRFYMLSDYPGWYSDEGSFTNVGAQLAVGRWGYFALRGSPLLIGRLPFFFMVMAGFFRIFGSSLITLRLLVAIEGLLTIIILYFTGRAIGGPKLGLLAAIFLTIYPWAIAYNRIGFSYNQLGLLLLISFACILQYSYTKKAAWALLATISAGLALTTDYLGVVAVTLVFIVLWVYDRQCLLWGCFWMVVTVLLVNAPVLLMDGNNFLADLHFTFSRMSVPLTQQLINGLFYYSELARREVWFLVGMLGLGFLGNKRARAMILFVCGFTLLLVVRNLLPVGRNYHHLIQLFPYLALGVAALVLRLLPEIVSIVRTAIDKLALPILKPGLGTLNSSIWQLLRSAAVASIVIFVALFPLMHMFITSFSGPLLGYFPVFALDDGHDLVNPADARLVIDYLQKHTNPNSVIAASPHIAWAVPGLQVDFAQVLVCDGYEAPVLPPLPLDRFAYSCGLEDVNYIVLDPLAHGYAMKIIPSMKEIINQVEQWPLVFSSGQLFVYRNPIK